MCQVTGGLAASVALTILCLPFLARPEKQGMAEESVVMEGTGFLHAIWLYRNQPELAAALRQVEDPTDHNLREAGMVRATLLERCLRGE
jgi:hypothetical protein